MSAGDKAIKIDNGMYRLGKQRYVRISYLNGKLL